MDPLGSEEISAENTPDMNISGDEPRSSCGCHSALESPPQEEDAAKKLPTRLVVTVQNRTGDKPADYFCDGLDLRVGDYCVAESDGTAFFGSVSVGRKPASLLCDKKKAVGKVIRAATPDDIKKAEDLADREDSAFDYCKGRIVNADLQMNLSAVHCAFDGLKVTFIFTAEGRVDFRELVRDLAGFTRMKVEMRQIGVRDEAKMLGGCGPCGKELCCASFLPDFVPVSIRMAKDQNLSLNPAKIAGVCGRLMCCLSYEHENYKELMSKAPKMGKQVVAPDGKVGRVAHINALSEKVGVIFEDGSRMEYGLTEVIPAHKWALMNPGVALGSIPTPIPTPAAQKPHPPVPRERPAEVERKAPVEKREETVAGQTADDERKSSRKRSRRRGKRGERTDAIDNQPSAGPVEPTPRRAPERVPERAPESAPEPEREKNQPRPTDGDTSHAGPDQPSSRHSRRQRGDMRRKQ
jgi:cell fate regulator YaaT (PSP1 superfamily)